MNPYKEDGLVLWLHRTLLGLNADQAHRFIEHFHANTHFVVESNGEMIALNHYWQLQLGALTQDTMLARSCLTTDESEASWKRHFSNNVLPIIVQANLPTGPLS